jgi:hypothetical protein
MPNVCFSQKNSSKVTGIKSWPRCSGNGPIWDCDLSGQSSVRGSWVLLRVLGSMLWQLFSAKLPIFHENYVFLPKLAYFLPKIFKGHNIGPRRFDSVADLRDVRRRQGFDWATHARIAHRRTRKSAKSLIVRIRKRIVHMDAYARTDCTHMWTLYAYALYSNDFST